MIAVHCCTKLKGEVCKKHKENKRNLLTISYPGLTPKTRINARFESLESVSIATASGINERQTCLAFLVEVESLGGTRRAGAGIDRFFTDRCIIITNIVISSTANLPRIECITDFCKLIQFEGIIVQDDKNTQ